LNHDPQTLPVGKRLCSRQSFKQFKRKIQAIGFFGIDGYRHLVSRRQFTQRQQPWVQLSIDTLHLRHTITRLQCRQFDRNTNSRGCGGAHRRPATQWGN
jgi:hypothetical protein